ncbi:MAG: hypothetical protein ABJ239_07445 [Erythrobacter sp.]
MAGKTRKEIIKNTEGAEHLPGPSTNPATNLLIADLVVRGVSRMTRKSLHQTVLKTGYSAEKAKKLAEDHTILSTLALYGLSKFATRSVPGAVMVGGGLLAKTLYDRGKARRVTKPAGAKQAGTTAKTALKEEK